MERAALITGIATFLAWIFVKSGAANGGILYNILKAIAQFFKWLLS
jgi:hypothetical protein